MMTLIRRDETLRGWPVWVGMIGINAGVMMGLLVSLAAFRNLPVPPSMPVLMAWFGVAALLLFGRVRTRGSQFQLALPLSARRLWIVHVLAVTLVGAALALVAVGAMTLEVHALDRFTRLAFDPLGLAAHLVAGVALAAVLLQLPSPRLARIPVTAGYALWAVVVVVTIPVLLVILGPMGPAGALVPLLLALAIGYWGLSTLPAGFTLIPFEAERAPTGAVSARSGAAEQRAAAEAAAAAGGNGTAPRWIVARAVLVSVSGGAKEWLAYPAVLFFAVIMGGVLGVLSDDTSDLRYLYIPLATFMLFSLVGPRLGRLQHLDPLPISRRVLFAVLVGPYLLALGAGYGLGALGAAVAARRTEFVDCLNIEGRSRVIVPRRMSEIAWNGHPRAVVSPWGESQAPTATPLWRGSRAVIYSPYSTPRGSSREFVGWQLSRAVQAVYGARIPPRELADRYLAAQGDTLVAAKRAGLSLRKDFPGLSPFGGGPMFPVLTMLVCVPWLLLVALLLRGYRPGMAARTRQALMWIPLAVTLAFLFGAVGAVMADVLQPWLFRVLVEIPVQKIGESPAATLGAWCLCGLLLLGGYRLAQRQFARMEIPSQPTKYVLVDWLREDS